MCFQDQMDHPSQGASQPHHIRTSSTGVATNSMGSVAVRVPTAAAVLKAFC
jgi:hypothetical protein